MNIVFKPILLFELEWSLFANKIAKNCAFFIFYINNIFRDFKFYYTQYIFLYNHLFLCIILFKLKLVFCKFKIGISKIFILRKKYKIDKRIRLKPNKIEKILNWPIF